MPKIDFAQHNLCKVKLTCSLVISIFLYACESWTLTAELEKRKQAFEMRCNRRLLKSSYKDHVTNEEVLRKIQAAIGEFDELLHCKNIPRFYGKIPGILLPVLLPLFLRAFTCRAFLVIKIW